MAQVVRLKYYAGLEMAEVALALGVSERTVKNDWAFAKAWLERELRGSAATGE
jgi:DNA-directed RNA polymerase specialized sigma24 family protein